MSYKLSFLAPPGYIVLVFDGYEEAVAALKQVYPSAVPQDYHVNGTEEWWPSEEAKVADGDGEDTYTRVCARIVATQEGAR